MASRLLLKARMRSFWRYLWAAIRVWWASPIVDLVPLRPSGSIAEAVGLPGGGIYPAGADCKVLVNGEVDPHVCAFSWEIGQEKIYVALIRYIPRKESYLPLEDIEIELQCLDLDDEPLSIVHFEGMKVIQASGGVATDDILIEETLLLEGDVIYEDQRGEGEEGCVCKE